MFCAKKVTKLPDLTVPFLYGTRLHVMSTTQTGLKSKQVHTVL